MTSPAVPKAVRTTIRIRVEGLIPARRHPRQLSLHELEFHDHGEIVARLGPPAGGKGALEIVARLHMLLAWDFGDQH
jgi:hypothetical protein